MGWATLIMAVGAFSLPQMKVAPPIPTFPVTMNRDGRAANKLRIEVSPTGVPLHCEVVDLIVTRGSPAGNGEALCASMLKDARYTPALDPAGNPITGVVFLWGHWKDGRWGGAGEPDWDPVELAVEVNKMPADYPEMTTFHLTLLVDRGGHVEQCAVQEDRLSNKTRALLCDQTKLFEAIPAKDAAGAPTPSIQPFRFRLSSVKFMDEVMQTHFPDVVARDKKAAKAKKPE